MLTYTRAELKQGAKNSLDRKWGLAICAYLLAVVVPSVVVSIVSGIFGGMSGVCMGNGAFGAGSFLMFLDYVAVFAIAFLVLGPITVGYSFFNLRLVRNMEVTSTMPYRCFSAGCYGRFTLTYFMMSLFIILWSLLFLIPGIIKSFSYAMTPYILMDHPEMGWKEAINESKTMMNGHKGDYFVLYLSFILWGLLVGVTCGIASLYVMPYMNATFANFYRSLKEEKIDVVKAIPAQA